MQSSAEELVSQLVKKGLGGASLSSILYEYYVQLLTEEDFYSPDEKIKIESYIDCIAAFRKKHNYYY